MKKNVGVSVLVLISVLFLNACSSDIEKNKRTTNTNDSDKVEAVHEEAEDLIRSAQGKDELSREQLVFRFRQYYLKSLDDFNASSEISDLQYPISEAEQDKMNVRLSKVGWVLKETEGSYYIGETGGWFESTLDAILTPCYREYFALRSKEMKEGLSDDAALLISWKQLKDRIVNWEKFINKYPHFVEENGVEQYLKIYIETFLTGTDNTSAFVDEGGWDRVDAQLKVALEEFLSENKDSRYYQLVKGYYDLMKIDNFIFNENLYTYLKEKGYKPMHGGRVPPLY